MRVKNTRFKVKLSYIEIYNEQIRDMLSDEQRNLQIVEDPEIGIIINDLKEVEAMKSVSEMAWMNLGPHGKVVELVEICRLRVSEWGGR